MADNGGPPFIPEYNDTVHEYRWRGRVFPSVTTVLQVAGLVQLPPVEKSVLDLAAERGRFVHEATARIDRGLTTDHLTGLQGYLDAYRSFCESRVFTPRAVYTEQPLCDPALELAGTPDRAGFLNATGTVVDLKTFEQPVPSTGLQLAGYRHLLRVNGFPVARRVAVHLAANGTFKLVEYRDAADDAAFLAALTLYRWRLKHLRKEAA